MHYDHRTRSYSAAYIGCDLCHWFARRASEELNRGLAFSQRNGIHEAERRHIEQHHFNIVKSPRCSDE